MHRMRVGSGLDRSAAAACYLSQMFPLCTDLAVCKRKYVSGARRNMRPS